VDFPSRHQVPRRDEPLLLAAFANVWSRRIAPRGAPAAADASASVIVMDERFFTTPALHS